MREGGGGRREYDKRVKQEKFVYNKGVVCVCFGTLGKGAVWYPGNYGRSKQ